MHSNLARRRPSMTKVLLVSIVASGFVAGCASVPKGAGQRSTLGAEAENALHDMTTSDAALRPLLQHSTAYIVFPHCGQGGFIVGAGGGTGVVYEHGKPSGYAELNQVSVGAEVGGQGY